jgi:hypothetical protein
MACISQEHGDAVSERALCGPGFMLFYFSYKYIVA